ncbi:MAG: hypothetical protein JNL50_15045 [Phycisphaerae bacterium]|nr:hypothetical protein [Phycisphaerae bacterium]
MTRFLERIAPVLRLTRVSSAFAVVANVWFVVLWVRAAPTEPHHLDLATRPLWLLLLASGLNAVSLFAFGATLNDLLDRRRDRLLRPDRPLARGLLTEQTAVASATGTLLASFVGAALLDNHAVLLNAVLAAAILVFNGAAKFVPAFGFVALGSIFAAHMFLPAVDLAFVVPAWLILTQATLVAALTHLWSRKPPRASPRALVATALAWVGVSGALAWLGLRKSATLWPTILESWTPAVVALLVLLMGALIARRAVSLGVGPRMAEKLPRYSSLWMPLYAVAWLLGAGLRTEAIIIGAVALAGYLSMSILREAYSLIEHPLGYRR